MNLRKLSNGRFVPAYQSDEEESGKIKEGTVGRWSKDRNPAFSRKAFALLNLAFSNQDKYADITIYRQVLTIKAGFVNWVDGKDGVKYPFAKSWSFEKMDEQEFEQMYKAILEVVSKEIGVEGAQIEAELAAFY